jgi:hypothetical protein
MQGRAEEMIWKESKPWWRGEDGWCNHTGRELAFSAALQVGKEDRSGFQSWN